jgi:hypothetical protein
MLPTSNTVSLLIELIFQVNEYVGLAQVLNVPDPGGRK